MNSYPSMDNWDFSSSTSAWKKDHQHSTVNKPAKKTPAQAAASQTTTKPTPASKAKGTRPAQPSRAAKSTKAKKSRRVASSDSDSSQHDDDSADADW
jgi:hypothetical protein